MIKIIGEAKISCRRTLEINRICGDPNSVALSLKSLAFLAKYIW